MIGCIMYLHIARGKITNQLSGGEQAATMSAPSRSFSPLGLFSRTLCRCVQRSLMAQIVLWAHAPAIASRSPESEGPYCTVVWLRDKRLESPHAERMQTCNDRDR